MSTEQQRRQREEQRANERARGMASVGKKPNQINSIWSVHTNQPSSSYQHQLDQAQRKPGFKK